MARQSSPGVPPPARGAVVVTGGAGHIGTNLVAALREDGEDVRVVDIREPRTARRLGATWVDADVRDGAAMSRAFAGADVVYHLAGVISVVGPLGGLVESVNVDGARTVAEAALRSGVRRLVHCSSIHAFDLDGAAVIDESAPRCVGPETPAYDRSKAAGEAAVLALARDGLDAVAVNPTGVLGPLDEAPSRMGSVLLALWRRRMPATTGGGFDWVDVRDVVAAMRSAADRGRAGQTYLVPGHRVAIPVLAEHARTCSGRAVTRWVAPLWAAQLSAPVATLIARHTESPLMPTMEALRALRSFPTVDGTKAKTELGHVPRPIEETVADLYQYFLHSGRLRG
jgi:dihydroflavonol-4-reductase